MFNHDQFHDPEFRNLVRAARAVIAERVGRGIATSAERLAVAALDEMPDEDDDAAVRARPPLGRRSGRVLRHHPRGLPVPGQHHVGRRRPPPRQLRRQTDTARVGGHRLDAGGPRRRLEPAAPPSAARAARLGPRPPGSRRTAASGARRRHRPFTNRTSLVSPSGFVLPRRTVTSTPSPAAASATAAHRRALTSLGRIPAITASSRPRSRATSSDAAARPVTGGEDRGQVSRHEGARLAPATAAGGPPVAGEHPGGAFPGRAQLAGEAGPEVRRGGSGNMKRTPHHLARPSLPLGACLPRARSTATVNPPPCLVAAT